ncbi:hypothetical protein D9M71_301340 [compost metagenome]
MRRVTFKIPGCTTARAPAFFRRQALGPVIGDQQLDRIDTFQLSQQVFPALEFQHGEVAAGDVQYGQAEQALIAEHSGDQVIATLIEQGFVTDGAGGDDAHYLAFDRPLAGGRVADLFANHHRLAQFHQLGQVALGRMEGDTAHGNRLARRLAAGGQGDVEEFGGFLRIFVEDFVEVTHAVEHQLVWVLVFQLPVLLHHRGMIRKIRHSRTWLGAS